MTFTEHLFNLKFAAKQMAREAKKCEKAEKEEKIKLKKVSNGHFLYIDRMLCPYWLVLLAPSAYSHLVKWWMNFFASNERTVIIFVIIKRKNGLTVHDSSTTVESL